MTRSVRQTFALAIACASASLPFTGGSAAAQTSPSPSHKHYDTPANYDQPPSPGSPVAPRLQNLGAHVFPVTTGSERSCSSIRA